MTAVPFLAGLQEAATAAADAEAAFRAEAARRIAGLQQARAYAFRRFNFMRGTAEAIAEAEDEAVAVARALAYVRTKLDWTGDSEVRTAVLDRFAPVVQALYAADAPGDEAAEGAGPDAEKAPDPAAALAAFEAWYAATHTTVFWALFEVYMPETPLVDF